MSAALYFGTGILSLANGTLILMVNPARTINRIFFFTSAWISLWFLCVFMAVVEGAQYTDGLAQEVVFWVRLSSSVAAFSIWIIWLMRSALLSESSLKRIVRGSGVWFLVSCLIGITTFFEDFIPIDSTPLEPRHGHMYFVYALSIGLSCIALLIDALQKMRTLTGAKRIQMQFFVFNTICACFVVVLLNLLGHIFGTRWPMLCGPVAFSGMHALTLWAICSHRIFDARQLVTSIARRVLFFAVLCTAVAALIPYATQVMGNALGVLGSVAIACFIAISCESALLRWLELDSEKVLLGPRKQLIEYAKVQSDTEEVRRKFSNFLRDWCQTERVELLFPRNKIYQNANFSLPQDWVGLAPLCRNGWLTPESIQRRRPEAGTKSCGQFMSVKGFGALLAIPRNTEQPSLIVALGRKQSLRPYTYPDIRQLIDLTELMDNILTHATLSSHASKLAQLESATMLSRSLAHDLNNLTMPVATYLLHTEGRAAPGTIEAEVHSAASHAVKVMNEHIRESLFFSRRLTPDIREIEPHKVLGDTVAVVRDRATQKRIALKSESCAASFRADLVLVQRLALNLLNNAIDASPPGSTVSIALSAGPRDTVTLSVKDQGPGVPVDIRRRIFDPYFTTKNTGSAMRGLGLGLAICRKIVDLHEGTIEVQDAPGGGALFTASFPIAGPRQPEDPAVGQPVNEPHPHPHRLGAVPQPA